MNRRSFLQAILASGCAPAIVKADSLMKIFVPRNEPIILYGDGIHDDTKALQTWFDGGRVLRTD